MIRNMGNCGNKEKLNRIYCAFQSAQQNQCGIIFVLDPLVYGKQVTILNSEEVHGSHLCHDRHAIYIVCGTEVVHTLPWWDITKVNVLW